jgi:hypothetical protein
VDCRESRAGELTSLVLAIANFSLSLESKKRCDRHRYSGISAASTSRGLGNDSTEVVNWLLELLRDEGSGVRARAALALAQLGDTSTEVVSGLLRWLRDKDSGVRSSAASALGRLGDASDGGGRWVAGVAS